jgi:hypothetical protein
MSISGNRNLKGGTKPVGRYTGKNHTAEVVKTKDGLRYRLADGQEFKSLVTAEPLRVQPGELLHSAPSTASVSFHTPLLLNLCAKR